MANSRINPIRRLVSSAHWGLQGEHVLLFLGLVLLVAAFALSSPFFLTAENLTDLLVQVSMIVPVTAGMTLVIITGEIDLSVASIMALTGAVVALLMVGGMPMPFAVVLGLILGLAIGLFNGFFSAYAGISSFMVTLATLSMGRGATLTLTGATQVAGLPESFRLFGSASLGVVPIPVLFMLVSLLAIHYLLAETRFGRHLYAIGGNREAASLIGLQVRRTKLAVFTLSGILASFSGIMLTSRLATASPIVATGWELTIITAVILGGSSLFGGKGNMLGTALGMLFVGVLNNGLSILNVSAFFVQLTGGMLIFAVVILDRLRLVRPRMQA